MADVRFDHVAVCRKKIAAAENHNQGKKLTVGSDGPTHVRGGRMLTHRFGRKLKLPSTIAIKHQIRMLMFEDALKTIEAAGGAEAGGAETGVGRELTGEVPAVALTRDDSIGVRKVAVANFTTAR